MSNIIEINEDKFQFKVKGNLLEISQATVLQEISHQDRLKKIEDEGMNLTDLYNANIDYLVGLGANSDVLKTISKNGLLKIIRVVGGEEEKK